LLATLNLDPEIVASIHRALEEDIGSGDVTTDSIVLPESKATAQVIARQDGVLSGLAVARAVFLLLDRDMEFASSVAEGARVVRGQTLFELFGQASALLTGERTALNFLSRMSGIATLTRQFVDAVAGTQAEILDTRKTAPGLRAIDKLAVTDGGGQNHRFGLYDMILIKDNHIDYAGSLTEAVRRVRECGTSLKVEVEAGTIEEVQQALDLGVARILLDNMPVGEMRDAVALNAGQAKLEASGSVTLENVREIAETGVAFISVGALTHSAKVFDVSLKWLS
jgi:nicotinate-nucleotide pyrophosphorylase (carboxylating)